MSEKYPYPVREHYEFPKNQVEQALEELRLHPLPIEMRQNVVALSRMYSGTAFARSMQQYSVMARSISITESGTNEQAGNFNNDFYSGTLLAMHANLAPAGKSVRHEVLRKNLLGELDTNPQKTLIVKNIGDYLDNWANGEMDNWSDFLANQQQEFQDVAMDLAIGLYDDDFSEEKQLDFLAGFTFASNLIWRSGMNIQTYPPV